MREKPRQHTPELAAAYPRRVLDERAVVGHPRGEQGFGRLDADFRGRSNPLAATIFEREYREAASRDSKQSRDFSSARRSMETRGEEEGNMRNSIRHGMRGLAVIGLLLASASTTPSRVEARSPAGAAVLQEPSPQKCCFTNPRHAGTCEVTPGAGETCGSILAYLNNPNSQGKTYCGNTTIRGGWQSASCATKK
jgi:hypothetical protein